MSESLHRVAQTSQGASAPSPALAEVAPQVQRLSFIGRMVRNPEWFTVGLILVTCLVVGTLNPRFFQFATLFDLLHSGTTVSLFALGTLVVLASGGIDVSFTAIAAFTMYSITKAVFAWWPDAPFFVILVCGAVGGVLLGLINGVLVHRLKAPSLIVTIGTQYLYRGLLLTFVGTQFFMNIPHSMDSFGQLPLFFYHTNDGLRAVLPVSVIALFLAAGVTWWLLNRTMMGRGVYAMGGSLPIAERLGYNLRAIHLFVFGYTGMLAGIAIELPWRTGGVGRSVLGAAMPHAMHAGYCRAIAGLAGVVMLLGLAGCGGGRQAYDGSDPNAAAAGLVSAPGRYYAPPGPAGDPWGPYIQEAAGRFGVPAQWVRAVMRQESGGQQQAVSSAGAIGLLQLMPGTYGLLREQYGLGRDPFEPHDNILAGTAYLRQMYDRYGAPGFLAAYNAGPQRLDEYLATGAPLPEQTVGYLTAVAPNLGPGPGLSGPLAVYAGGIAPVSVAPTQRSLAAGCDADAAYDPEHPCRALERAAAAAAAVTAVAVAPMAEPAMAEPAMAEQPVAVPGQWAIQVGAFTSVDLARGMAERAAAQVPELAGAAIAVPTTAPFGGQVLYRARLVALSAQTASVACRRLNARQLPCIVVRPGAAA